MNKQRKLYQVREWVGNEYSKQLGFKLRSRASSARIVKELKMAGRSVFSAQVLVQA